VNRLLREGIKVTVLTFDRVHSETIPYVKKTSHGKPKVEIVRVGPLLREADADLVLSQRRLFCETAQDICNEKKIDVIHGFYASGAGFLAGITAKLSRKPLVISVRGNDVARDMYDFKKFYTLKWCFEQARSITCVNQKLKDTIDAVYDVGSKTQVIHNGIDPHMFSSRQTRPKGRRDILTVGFIGIIKEKKGIQTLFEAVSKSNFFLRKKIKIMVIGDAIKESGKKFYETTRRRWRNIKVEKTGILSRSKALNQLAKVDIVCVPSIDDGLPNTLLEAMALEKTLLVSDYFDDIVTHNKEALIFQRGNPDDLAKKLVQLTNDPELRKKLARNAKIKAHQYSDVVEAQSYIRLYKKVAKR
jgi:glycosyltransferase involved in cell wall biosynthesis